jgi:hypothetical protein
VTFFADHCDGSILINLPNATDSGIGRYASTDDEILMVFHVFPFFGCDARLYVPLYKYL